MRWASASRSQISAEHGEGLSDLYDALRALMPEPAATGSDDDDDIDERRGYRARPIRVAIVGRPNAGKSTLINRLLGEERLLDQRRGRHHPRFHFRAISLAGARISRVRHRRHAAHSRIEEKLEKLVGVPMRCARSASPKSWCC